MLMKKLSEDHYIIMDDSEIKVGDWYYLPRTNSVYRCKEDPTELNLERRWGIAKITHSTQPLDKSLFFTDRVWSCERLSLGKVKELFSKVDVEKKAQSAFTHPDFGKYKVGSVAYYNGYKDGYNQALEDNKDKKYTEEDLRKAIIITRQRVQIVGSIDVEGVIQSLQPQTEWEVEFVDGKLKLKS